MTNEENKNLEKLSQWFETWAGDDINNLSILRNPNVVDCLLALNEVHLDIQKDLENEIEDLELAIRNMEFEEECNSILDYSD